MRTARWGDPNLALKDAWGESPGSGYSRQGVPANVIGVPALSVPAGFSAGGLPIGVAIFGRPLDEATLFRIARAYEVKHDWYRRVPNLEPAAEMPRSRTSAPRRQSRPAPRDRRHR